jgi:hypothetical protein
VLPSSENLENFVYTPPILEIGLDPNISEACPGGPGLEPEIFIYLLLGVWGVLLIDKIRCQFNRCHGNSTGEGPVGRKY